MSKNTPAPPNPDDGNKGGRKPKLTPLLLEAVVKLLIGGNFRSAAARQVGITDRTFRRWMRMGRKFPDGIYGPFRRAVLLAESHFESRAVEEIREAGREDPKFLCWLLERKFPERWGRFRGELAELRKDVRELERAVRATEPKPG